ncbi:hypothetical protein CISIN_1g041506mg, partial [Citrus sinensis]
CYIITACCLLHNLIRREMSVDPLEHELIEIDNNEVQDANNITTLEASDQWTGWRNDSADAIGGHIDNGFKSGTFIHLEKVLNQKLPNCGLKASSHIDSKIRKWKKQYGLMFDMLNTSS